MIFINNTNQLSDEVVERLYQGKEDTTCPSGVIHYYIQCDVIYVTFTHQNYGALD